MRHQFGHPEWPIRFKNVSGEEIPAYACMQATGNTTNGSKLALEMNKPDAEGSEAYFINGPNAIADTKYGNCRSIHDAPFWVKYNNSATETVGTEVGPRDDSWEFDESATTGTSNDFGLGFIILAVADIGTGGTPPQRAFVQPRALGWTWEGELTEALSTGNEKTGAPAEADCTLWVRSGNSSTQLKDGPTITVTNRSTSLQGSSGDYVIGIIVNGEFRIIAKDC